jgi:hypothetical protein
MTIVPNTTDVTEPDPKSPRQVLAAIALAELPMPHQIILWAPGEVSKEPCMKLDFRTMAEGEQWLTAHGGTPSRRWSDGSKRYHLDHDGGSILWLGWRLHCHASEALSPEPAPLDDETREQLRAVAS